MMEDLQLCKGKSSKGQSVNGSIYGVKVGTAIYIDQTNQFMVDYANNCCEPMHARVALSNDELRQIKGRTGNSQVLLVFENGDPHRPIIIGLLWEQTQTPAEFELNNGHFDDIVVDGRRFVFDAQEEIVLRCGQSSVTLRKDGKIVIRGSDLVSRSTGGNRIKGSTVRIN